MKLWELGLFLPTFAIFCWAIVERHEIFEDAVRDYSSGHSYLLLCWTVPAFFVLLFSRPWRLRSKFGSILTMFGLVICSLSFAFVFSGHYSHYRFRILKFELERWPLKIALGPERPAKSLSKHLFNYETGPMLLADKPLLERIAREYGGRLLVEDNRATALVWLALKKHGVTFAELWNAGEHEDFLLSCWQAQADSVTLGPDYEFEWSKSLIDSDSRLLTSEQTGTVTNYFFEHRGELSNSELQVVLQSAFRDVGRLPQNQIDELLENWKEQLTDFSPVIATALEKRVELRKFLGDSKQVRLAVRVGDWEQSTYNVLYDSVPSTLDSMISAWFGSSGVAVEWADWEKAEMRLQIVLKESSESNYSRDPSIETISLALQKSSGAVMEWKEVPYYWSQFFYDEKPYRIWPFGFDRKLLDREEKYFW